MTRHCLASIVVVGLAQFVLTGCSFGRGMHSQGSQRLTVVNGSTFSGLPRNETHSQSLHTKRMPRALEPRKASKRRHSARGAVLMHNSLGNVLGSALFTAKAKNPVFSLLRRWNKRFSSRFVLGHQFLGQTVFTRTQYVK